MLLDNEDLKRGGIKIVFQRREGRYHIKSQEHQKMRPLDSSVFSTPTLHAELEALPATVSPAAIVEEGSAKAGFSPPYEKEKRML